MNEKQKGSLISMGFGDPSWAFELDSSEKINALSDEIESFIEDELSELDLVLNALTHQQRSTDQNPAALELFKIHLNSVCRRIDESPAFKFFHQASLYTLKRLGRFSKEGERHYKTLQEERNILKYAPACLYLDNAIDYPWSTAGIHNQLTYYYEENNLGIDSILGSCFFLVSQSRSTLEENLQEDYPYISISAFKEKSQKNLMAEYFVGNLEDSIAFSSFCKIPFSPKYQYFWVIRSAKN